MQYHIIQCNTKKYQENTSLTNLTYLAFFSNSYISIFDLCTLKENKFYLICVFYSQKIAFKSYFQLPRWKHVWVKTMMSVYPARMASWLMWSTPSTGAFRLKALSVHLSTLTQNALTTSSVFFLAGS